MTDDSLWVDGPDGFEDLDGAKPAPKTKRKPESRERFIGCPLWWFKAVYPVVQSKNELIVALALWRLRKIYARRTVTVANAYMLAELGINRWTKYRALKRLADAGLITVKREGNHALVITFARRGKQKRPPVRVRHKLPAGA
jgi:hypothetical protein